MSATRQPVPPRPLAFKPFSGEGQAAVRLRQFGLRTVGPGIGTIYADRVGGCHLAAGSTDNDGISRSLAFQSWGPIDPRSLPQRDFSGPGIIPRHRILEDAAQQVLARRRVAGPAYRNPYAAARFGPQFGNPPGGPVLDDTGLDLLSVGFDAVGIVIGAAVVLTATAVTLPVVLAGAALVGSVILLGDDGTLLSYDLLNDKAKRTSFDDSRLHHVTEIIGGALLLGDFAAGGYNLISEVGKGVTKEIPEEAKVAKLAIQKAQEAGEKSADYASQVEEMRSRFGETPVKPRRVATMRELDTRAKAFAEKQAIFNKQADKALEKIEKLKRDFAVKLMKEGPDYIGETFSETMIAKNLLDYYEGQEARRKRQDNAKPHGSFPAAPGGASPLATLQPSGHSAPGTPSRHHITIHAAAKFALNHTSSKDQSP